MPRVLPIFLLLAVAMHAETPKISEMGASGRADGKEFYFSVTAEGVKATPPWRLDSSCPPLEPREAISIATKQLHNLVKNAADWYFTELHLDQFSGDQWVYLVKFDRRYPENAAVTLGDYFQIPVLMSGATLEPKIRTLPPDSIENSK